MTASNLERVGRLRPLAGIPEAAVVRAVSVFARPGKLDECQDFPYSRSIATGRAACIAVRRGPRPARLPSCSRRNVPPVR
jgi:hypothetical protein